MPIQVGSLDPGYRYSAELTEHAEAIPCGPGLHNLAVRHPGNNYFGLIDPLVA
jgi:hypothetical protein